MSSEIDLALERPPEGFLLNRGRGPFTSHNGPSFVKETPDVFLHGLRLKDRHCNGHGIVHGGMLMAFADGLMGHAVWRAAGIGSVTVRMTSDFLSLAKPGEWLEGTATVTRTTKSVAFAEARVYVGDRSVLLASGVFKLLPKRMRRQPISSESPSSA